MRRSVRSRARAIVCAVAAIATFVTLAFVFAGAARADDTPTITGPMRVYPVENTTMNFTGADPISGENKLISAAGTVEGNDCDDSTGNDYSPDDCPRIQMDLNTTEAGLLNIPGLVVKSDSPDNVDHTVSPDGAVITNSSNGVDPSQLFDFNGTEDQLNKTLKTVQFIPATDYREKRLDPATLPDLHVVVVNGDDALQADIHVKVKVEGPNQGPSIAIHQTPLKAVINEQADYVDDADVLDPEMCTTAICGDPPYTNSVPIADPDSNLLLVAWLDNDCGKFNFLGAQFSNNGSVSNNNVDSLLLNSQLAENQDNGYNPDQRTAIEASIDPTALTLDLTQETGSASQDTTVFAGISDLDNVDYALAHIEYTPPATVKTCHLNVTVSDLGNLGTPTSFVDSTNPTYEIPDAKGASGQVTFDVQDTHPHVTVEQTPPGPIPGVDPTHVKANYAVTFDQAVDTFDASDISTAGSDAGLSISCTAVNVTPDTVWDLACSSDKDGTIKVSVPAGKVYAQGHTGESDYANADSTSSDNSITWDATDPTVTIDPDTDDGQTSPTGTAPIKYTVVFSEKTSADVPGTFTGDDIDLSTSTAGGTLHADVSDPAPAHLNTFTVTVTGMTTPGNVIATVKPSVVVDQALNPNDASTSTGGDNVIAWQPAPTVTVNKAGGQDDPTSTAPIVFTAVFSEDVSGFDENDIDFAGSTAAGTLQAAVSGSGPVYTITVTGMTGSGDVEVSIPANSVMDSLSQQNAASTSSDNIVAWEQPAGPPSVTINQAVAQDDPTNANSVKFDVQFSTGVTGFDDSDISFAGSTVGGTPAVTNITGGPSAYTITVSGYTSDGIVKAAVKAGAAQDSSSNLSLASTSTDNEVTIDTVAPTVSINKAGAQDDPTNGTPIKFTATFSEDVKGFTGADVDLSTSTAGGTLMATVSGGPKVYEVDVSGMTSDGNVVATIPSGGYTDLAGNASVTNSTSADNSVKFDNTAPTVTIDKKAGQDDPTSVTPINFTATFSEPVTGFDGTAVKLSDSTVGGTLSAVVTGGPTVYNVAVSGMTTSGDVIASVPANKATDLAGNGNDASTSGDNTVTWQQPLQVTVDQAAAQADPTNSAPIDFHVVFSASVNDFVASDVTLGGTAGAATATVSGSGSDYTVHVSGMTGDGTVTANVPAGVAHDSSNSPNVASTSTDNHVTYDTTKPHVTVNQGGAQADPTNASPVDFDVHFSEHVTGFIAANVTLGGTAGATTATVSGSGTDYTVHVSGMTSDGTVTASVAGGLVSDDAGNTNTASTSTDSVVHYDTTKPNVTINKAAAQSDPTSSSPIAFSVVFTEPVTGFTAQDLAIIGTSNPSHATVSGSGANYTVDLSGMTQSGTVIVSVPAGAAVDAAGNTSNASTSSDNSVKFNKPLKPSVTINQAASQHDPTKTSPIRFTVVFSEPVSGFTGSDVDLGGTAHPSHATATGSGASYTLSVSGMTASGTVTVTVPAGVAHSASSQTNTASTSTDNSVHFTKTGSQGGGHGHIKPKVTINRAPGQADPTKMSSIKFRVVFSKPVIGFSASDVRLHGTAHPKHVIVTGGGRKYAVTVSGMTHGGWVRASIPAGVVTDVANNPNRASTSSDNLVTYNPTITLKTKHGEHISLSVIGGVLTVFKTIHSHIKPPPGTKAKWGEWTFTATSKKHAIVTFKLTLPAHPSSYLKLLNGAWKEFTWNGTTGARINGNVVTIKIRDNGRGDSNSTLGVVNDPGAPVLMPDGN